MSKDLSAFSRVDMHPSLWTAQKGNLRCTALKLRDGSLCLYSPVSGLSDRARKSLDEIGDVRFLLAPNHYHNKGLVEYAQTFPQASLVCSSRAEPRLKKQTGLSLSELDVLAPMLPDACSILEPDGLKTGETWWELVHSDQRIWVVTDAFAGPSGPVGLVSDAISLLGTFPKFGIDDKENYSAWVSSRIADRPPSAIIPCHGALLECPDLAARISALLD